MTDKTNRSGRPRGLMRLLLRAPTWLYRARLGWLLGGRFLMISHKGRKSGLTRRTVLEVAGHEKESNSYLVASGWGRRSDWYQNILHDPDVELQVGRVHMTAQAVALPKEESGQAMVDYARAHPKAARGLMRTLGFSASGAEEEYRQIGHDHVPFVRLRPRPHLATSPESG